MQIENYKNMNKDDYTLFKGIYYKFVEEYNNFPTILNYPVVSGDEDTWETSIKNTKGDILLCITYCRSTKKVHYVGITVNTFDLSQLDYSEFIDMIDLELIIYINNQIDSVYNNA